jgi:hypothetical protein
MVGPSMTKADRKRILLQLKVGFALLVGLSMGLVALYSAGGPLLALGLGVAGALVGGVLAQYTFPDSIAETPYEDDRERGPKPGVRTRRRRERSDGGEDQTTNRGGRR